MQNVPKILQTRDDFDLALDLARAGDVSKLTVAQHFSGLAEAAHHFEFNRVLATGDAADGTMPDYCVIDASEQDPIRRQLKRTIDPDARIFSLGYTLADITAIINELEIA